MNTKQRFTFLGFALMGALLLTTAVNSAGTGVQIAHAATKALTCITIGVGLTPSGKQCNNFTLAADFTPSGGSNGTANNVARGDHDHFGQAWSGASANGLSVTNSQGVGLYGVSAKDNGVFGVSSSKFASGVYGSNTSAAGYGVAGRSTNGGVGVYGESNTGVAIEGMSNTGVAVNGKSSAGQGVLGVSQSNNGVEGHSASPKDSGVYGVNTSAGGFGVAGRSTSGGAGVYGESKNGDGVTGQSTKGNGVAGQTPFLLSFGVEGINTAPCEGEFCPQGIGVHGKGNTGVSGEGLFSGVSGTSVGGYGVNGVSSNGVGVYGQADNSDGAGVNGENTSGAGVRGNAGGGQGVLGISQSNNGVEGHSSGATTSGVYGENFSGGYGVAGRANGSGTGVLGDNTSSTGWAGYFNGRVYIKTLKIADGSDLAEQFSDARDTQAEPGTVMVIDAEHPGQLQISTSAYDNKVAGIVSGAGNINTGLTLQQDGVLGGNIAVTLVGRVYCQAEALSNPINPGDLMTTSALPGHCMKAADPTRANGAIIGKAMTGLAKGTGLVLVLVNLQ